MAKDKPASSDDRIYTIPLRAGWSTVPSHKRANRAVNEIKSFVSKHAKTDETRVSHKLNTYIWKRGNSKPPASVKVKVSVKAGLATARLPDELVIEKKKEGKKPVPKNKIEELKQKAEEMKAGKQEAKKDIKSVKEGKPVEEAAKPVEQKPAEEKAKKQ
jgi:large subunit ribosomal protein L31e